VHFEPATASVPVVGMAHFARRAYRCTVRRLIFSSRAIRRWDHPLAAKLSIACCSLTFRTLPTLHPSRLHDPGKSVIYAPKSGAL
jgi:hypothetical protein